MADLSSLSDEDLMRMLHEAHADATSAEPTPQYNIGASGFGDAMRQVLHPDSGPGPSLLSRNFASAGMQATNLWQGLKQRLGGTADPQQVEAARILTKDAPVGALAGGLAMTLPTLAI